WPAEQPRIPRVTLRTWVDRVRIPAAQVSAALAATLVHGTGSGLEALARAADTATGATPRPLAGVEVELTTSVERTTVPDRNVLALLEGSDPRLKNEVVIVCAHIDHNGADGPNIYNGADDDGSGIVALLEIAEAYARAADSG